MYPSIFSTRFTPEIWTSTNKRSTIAKIENHIEKNHTLALSHATPNTFPFLMLFFG